jgi:AGCS family alanine or glycine:cation symporter
VLQCQYGSWYQYGYLLAICSGFERCTHGHFRLTKAHIAANETILAAGADKVAYSVADLAGLAGITKANLAQQAFTMAFGGSTAAGIIGSIFVAICLFFFAFSTILSWNYFGKVNFLSLFGKKSYVAYGCIAVVFVFLGAIFQNDLVWELTDMFNNLMVIPNVIALFALSAMVVSATKFGKKNDLEIK